jgi:predicted lipoprotein with Yx(FWY)xxD motif
MRKSLLVSTLFMASTVAMAASHGMNLTNKSGLTLYTFDKDSVGMSVCYDGCAVKWPPFSAKEGAEVKEGWGMTERKDGSKQWTYKGQPLYTWIGDKEAGDITGDGIGGVWHIAKKAKAYSY